MGIGMGGKMGLGDKGDKGDKGDVRGRLGLRAGDPTALLVGGADGVGKVKRVTKALVHRLSKDLPSSQVVIVCGRNERTRKALASQQWPSNVLVKILGFSSNMHELMEACDCIITKV
ncbi:unnamed protein product [Discosporangium mesarthrocarpum]